MPWRVADRVKRTGEVWLGGGADAGRDKGATLDAGFLGEGAATGSFFGDAVVEREEGLVATVFLGGGRRGPRLGRRFFLAMILVMTFFVPRDGRRPLRDGIFVEEAPRASRFILFPALRTLGFGFFSALGSGSVYSSSSESEEKSSSGS